MFVLQRPKVSRSLNKTAAHLPEHICHRQQGTSIAPTEAPDPVSASAIRSTTRTHPIGHMGIGRMGIG
jgi:hypothetical protein